MQNNDYNIKTYTDQECFDILNLNNPTDRELEMKILSFMDKYETKSPRLYEFFESMYDRFFSNEEGDDHALLAAEHVADGREKGGERREQQGGAQVAEQGILLRAGFAGLGWHPR
jgi:hypothetical protein